MKCTICGHEIRIPERDVWVPVSVPIGGPFPPLAVDARAHVDCARKAAVS